MKGRTWGSLRWLLIAPWLSATPALAQGHSHGAGGGAHPHATLHINPRWRECSFQLDPSLTPQAWRQFAGEAGVVTYFRPVVGAQPMGRGKFEVSVLQWSTGISDEDAAWNDTFVHPDSVHWLFEGEALQFPGLTLRAGISDKTDVGVYFTKSPGANYGFVGGQLQQNLVGGDGSGWAASARVSFVSMYGPEDLEFNVYGVDLLASREFPVLWNKAFVSPYAGVSASLSRAHEKSSVVSLADENVLGALATLGAAARISAVRLGVEYNIARVSSLSFKIGFAN